MMPRRLRTALAGLTLVLATSGCAFNGIYSLPLPGAVANRGHTYSVKVEFRDVLDLVPYSAVKVNGATVGHVTSVKYQAGHAVVSCKLLASAKLPANATAQIQQTSILGEKYVELESPANTPAQGTLASGDTIRLPQTNRDVSVEEVLGALSALLNEGGLAQVHTIAHEVNSALNGNTSVARDLLGRLADFASGLNQQRHDIITAISGVDKLSRTVKGQESQLIGALNRLPAGLKVLTDDRRQLTSLLVSLQHLSHVAVRTIHATQADLLSNLHALRPTLDKLKNLGTVIPKTLGILITYPAADGLEAEYKGDYGNLALTVDLSKESLSNFLKGSQAGGGLLSTPASKGSSSVRSSKADRKALTKQVESNLSKVLHPVGSTDITGLLLGDGS